MTNPRRSASMGVDLSRLRSLCLSGVAKRCREPRFVNAPSRALSSLLTMVVPKLPASLETVRDLGAQPQKKTIPFHSPSSVSAISIRPAEAANCKSSATL